MAKDEFAVGDVVRLTRKIEYGNIKLKPTKTGVIRDIAKKFLGKTEYKIRWSGTNFDMTMYGSSNFVPAQVDDSSGVYKS